MITGKGVRQNLVIHKFRWKRGRRLWFEAGVIRLLLSERSSNEQERNAPLHQGLHEPNETEISHGRVSWQSR